MNVDNHLQKSMFHKKMFHNLYKIRLRTDFLKNITNLLVKKNSVTKYIYKNNKKNVQFKYKQSHSNSFNCCDLKCQCENKRCKSNSREVECDSSERSNNEWF